MTDKSENDHNARLRPFDDALVALSFFTRVPVPARQRSLAGAGYCFPLVGALVGGFGALILTVSAALGLSPWIGAFLAVAATALVTGALHEDGLADTADGLASGRSAQARLEIMRDSRTGAFGVLALILATGLKAAALASMAAPAAALALVAAHAAARGVLPSVMAMMPTASTTGMAARAGRPSLGAAGAAAAIGAVLVLALLAPRAGLTAMAAVAAIAWIMCWLARRLFGGYNGDVLGAIEQVAEIAVLVAAASGGRN